MSEHVGRSAPPGAGAAEPATGGGSRSAEGYRRLVPERTAGTRYCTICVSVGGSMISPVTGSRFDRPLGRSGTG